MRRTKDRTPADWVATTASGYLVSLASLIAFSAYAFQHGSSHTRQTNWLWLVPFVFLSGTVMGQIGLTRLRNGVRLDRWSGAELQAAQVQVDRRSWTMLVWFIAIAGCASGFISTHGILSSACMAYFWFPSALISLRWALRKPYASQPKTFDWSIAKKLQSDHWGTPKVS